MKLPPLRPLKQLVDNGSVLYVAAIGFERRSEEILRRQPNGTLATGRALLFQYSPQQGKPREKEMREQLKRMGLRPFTPIIADASTPVALEDSISMALEHGLHATDEVIVDISAMSKLLILLLVCKLRSYNRKVKFVYTELADYSPSKAAFDAAMLQGRSFDVPLPSRGSESVVRSPALSSIRMQGQPVTLVAFTSFNEQLVRHVLASVSPHCLVLVGGVPPRANLAWREMATQRIHHRLIEEYRSANLLDDSGRLQNRVSTLDYSQTYELLLQLHERYGRYERLMAAATGSKMQTLGLAVARQVLPDIHIEYPTPKSYYVKEDNPYLVADVHEVSFHDFGKTIDTLRAEALNYHPGFGFVARGE